MKYFYCEISSTNIIIYKNCVTELDTENDIYMTKPFSTIDGNALFLSFGVP